jgi:gluconate 2-dehydrogenase gamma chain
MRNEDEGRIAAAPPRRLQVQELSPLMPARRTLLGSALSATTLSLLPLDSVRSAEQEAPPAALPDDLLQVLAAFTDRIIPEDENGPGALAAGAAIYIDRSLGQWNAAELPALSAGLRALDALARRRFAASFTALADGDKDALLQALEAGEVEDFPDARGFFNRLYRLTLEGTFSDPYYGGNRNYVGWDLIGYPGAVMASTPEMQRMGGRLPPLHTSAYGEAHDGH